MQATKAKELLTIKYQKYIDMKLREKLTDQVPSTIVNGKDMSASTAPANLSVGIVGGGIAGLYSALLLQNYIPGVKVKIFEANNRVGGCIFTYKFSDEPYQYYEAGAMRVPCSPCQNSFFQLVDYLNKAVPTNPLHVMDLKYSCPSGNRVLVNGMKQKDGRVMSVEYAQKHCSELGFPPQADVGDSDDAGQLLADALQPVITAMTTDFMAAMDKYGHISLHNYLLDEAGWTQERINYFEVMDLQTNSSHTGLVDIFFNYFIRFHGEKFSWKTIEGGMSRLPELCAEAITLAGGEIILNAKVESMQNHDENGLTKLGYVLARQTSNALTYESFDAVVMAIPTSCIRMMPDRPRWPADMEHSLRSLRHHPLNKIGLRFNSRFWERSDLQQSPSYGGRSITDLPSRWIIYPSFGLGDSGKGILSVYTWLADSMHWLSRTNVEKIQLVLRDLQLLYPEVDIAGEYAGGTDATSDSFTKEAHIIDWVNEWSMGIGVLYYPGQFGYFYPILAQPRGNTYFAGDHISTNPAFISGALESAKTAVQQLVSRNHKELKIDYLKV